MNILLQLHPLELTNYCMAHSYGAKSKRESNSFQSLEDDFPTISVVHTKIREKYAFPSTQKTPE